ncbi:MAG: pantoate--beta-alanine ligase [Actinobacteria bacterium]|nr:pantoate--beta-alanine ligase [Actinomycetota bacterium]
METIKGTDSIYRISQKLRQEGHTIGLVPTMGYLHDGHVSLIRKSIKDCTRTVVSIFVNPAQFGPKEDLKKYPRDLQRDIRILKETGADYVFVPETDDMYSRDHKTGIKVKGLEKIMCGKFRPHHFSGVCTVVLKLFNLVCPHRAYFGEKDYQQLVIIKQMAADLNIPVKIKGCPIVRESDGLALSSRNSYLTCEERKNATVLFENLLKAAGMLKRENLGLREIKAIIMKNILSNNSVSKVDYFDFRKPENLEEIKNLKQFRQESKNGKILIATAVWIGSTRLIDNMVV